jgi:ketosteroid isomerase-like protein
LLWTAAPASDRQEIERATAHFLTSFENLDMPAFIACFADDASAFFPAPEPPERVAGKAAIRSRFQQVFDAIRKGASGEPPYHRLEPQDLQVQSLGVDAAVVTFHLRNSERIARRTLVFKQVHGVWLIAHLHASNFQL